MSSEYIAVLPYQNRLNNENPVNILYNLWSWELRYKADVSSTVEMSLHTEYWELCDITALRSTGVNALTSPNDTSVAVTSSISIRVFARIFAHRIVVTVTIIWVLIFSLVMNLWWSDILLPVMCPIEIFRWHILGWLHVFADSNTIYKTSYQCQEAKDEKHYAEDPATTH